jgi:hypothetical protein
MQFLVERLLADGRPRRLEKLRLMGVHKHCGQLSANSRSCKSCLCMLGLTKPIFTTSIEKLEQEIFIEDIMFLWEKNLECEEQIKFMKLYWTI